MKNIKLKEAAGLMLVAGGCTHNSSVQFWVTAQLPQDGSYTYLAYRDHFIVTGYLRPWFWQRSVELAYYRALKKFDKLVKRLEENQRADQLLQLEVRQALENLYRPLSIKSDAQVL